MSEVVFFEESDGRNVQVGNRGTPYYQIFLLCCVCILFTGLFWILKCILRLSYGQSPLPAPCRCLKTDIPVCGLKLVITKSISHTFIHLLCKSMGYGESYFYTKQPYLPVPQINTNRISYFHHRHRQTTIPCSPVQIVDCVCWKLCHLLAFVKPRCISLQVSTYLIFSIFQLTPLLKQQNHCQMYGEQCPWSLGLLQGKVLLGWGPARTIWGKYCT